MRRLGVVVSVLAVVSLIVSLLGLDRGPALAADRSGEQLFKQHCAVCHPDGGNIINPEKTLHKKDLAANHVTKPQDIVERMRNPGPGMLKFDAKTIPDQEAKEIAEYVLSHFNK